MSIGERITLGVILVVGVLLTVFTFRFRDRADASACATLYTSALTAADTARIDLQLPPMEQSKSNHTRATTCGALRGQGLAR